MTKKNPAKISAVLCDSGESETGIATGDTIEWLEEIGKRILDGACLTNVVVVRTSDGKHYVGEFAFELREVSAKVAGKIAKDFGPDCEGCFDTFAATDLDNGLCAKCAAEEAKS